MVNLLSQTSLTFWHVVNTHTFHTENTLALQKNLSLKQKWYGIGCMSFRGLRERLVMKYSAVSFTDFSFIKKKRYRAEVSHFIQKLKLIEIIDIPFRTFFKPLCGCWRFERTKLNCMIFFFFQSFWILHFCWTICDFIIKKNRVKDFENG